LFIALEARVGRNSDDISRSPIASDSQNMKLSRRRQWREFAHFNLSNFCAKQVGITKYQENGLTSLTKRLHIKSKN